MDPKAAQIRLERLRAMRVYQPRSTAAAPEFAGLGRTLRKLERAAPKLGDIWQEHAPQTLRDRVRFDGVARGTLFLRVPTDADRHELSLALRSGLEDALLRGTALSVRRVRVVVGEGGPSRR